MIEVPGPNQIIATDGSIITLGVAGGIFTGGEAMNENAQFVPVSRLREAEAEIAALRERAERAEADAKIAASELLIPTPEPGTDMFKVLLANRLMRYEIEDATMRAAKAEAKLSQVYQLTLDKTYSAFSALGEINHITEPPAHDAGKDER